jgi:hypothetical protein
MFDRSHRGEYRTLVGINPEGYAMTTNESIPATVFQCGPGDDAAEACVACAPKMVLTHEEEAILKTMREIKAQARPVSDKLKEIQGRLASAGEATDNRQPREEFEELSGRLEEMRTQWKQWEKRLDEAIENKLIMLGHRQPRQ